MSIQVDNAELMSLLESSDVHTSSQVRELIQEQLNTGRKSARIVNVTISCYMVIDKNYALYLILTDGQQRVRSGYRL